MSVPPDAALPTTRSRKRRTLLVLVLALVVTGAAGVAWWRTTRQALSDEERHLVGTWTYQWDGTPMNVVLEYEFRPDRTCRIRTIDPNTGALTSDRTNARWWLTGNRLTVRHPKVATGRIWHVLPSQRSADEVSILTPDGPDRFRYTGTIEVRSTPTQPPVTGTITRVPPEEIHHNDTKGTKKTEE